MQGSTSPSAGECAGRWMRSSISLPSGPSIVTVPCVTPVIGSTPAMSAPNAAWKPFSASPTKASSSSREGGSETVGGGARSRPSASSAATIRGSARRSWPSVRLGSPSRPGSSARLLSVAVSVMSLLSGCRGVRGVDEPKVVVDVVGPPAAEDLRILDRAAAIRGGEHARLPGLERVLVVERPRRAVLARLDAVHGLLGDQLAPPFLRLGADIDRGDATVLECPDQLRHVPGLIPEHERLVDRHGGVVEPADDEHVREAGDLDSVQ